MTHRSRPPADKVDAAATLLRRSPRRAGILRFVVTLNLNREYPSRYRVIRGVRETERDADTRSITDLIARGLLEDRGTARKSALVATPLGTDALAAAGRWFEPTLDGGTLDLTTDPPPF